MIHDSPPRRTSPIARTRARTASFSRFFAREVEAGSYPFVRFDADRRWHQRIYRDRGIDVWLISWLPSQGTELHDHGGSSGAFTVLAGELSEAVPVGTRIRESVVPSGRTVSFGPRYVHDVRNLAALPAVSVHAYSPPLTSMTFYDLGTAGPIAVRTLRTDDPEPVLEVAS